MAKIISAIKPFYKASLWKALLAGILFLLLYQFQDQNIIRENVDDIAFDIIDKLYLSTKQQDTGDDLVTVLAFDNAYMKNHGLFDANKDIANYGYTFPRKHIAAVITRLDRRLANIAKTIKNPCPKALFIDFDLSYTTNESGKLSEGDKELLKTLANPDRCYPILLPLSHTHNIIKESKDPIIQALIGKKIFFVSPFFHFGSDDVTRRYEPIKKIAGENYPAAPLALWQIIKYGEINTQQIESIADPVGQQNQANKTDESINVNSTMIWLKHYHKDKNKDGIQASHWTKLQKRSLNNTQPIPHDRLINHVLLLGGTDKEDSIYKPSSGDHHKVLSFINTESMAGVDIHANTLMTLLHLTQGNQQTPIMQQLHPAIGVILVFISFFLISLSTQLLLKRFNTNSEQWGLTLSVIVNLVILFIISILLLQSEKHLWFNWFSIFVLFETIEGVLFIKGYLPLFLKLFAVRIIRKLQKQLLMQLKFIQLKVTHWRKHHD